MDMTLRGCNTITSISLLFVFIDVNDGNNLGMTENESREIKVDILRSWNITASITFSSSFVLVIF